MIEALLDTLACYRLTRLITRDGLTVDLRAAVIRAAYGSQDALALPLPSWWETPAEWEERAREDDDPPKLAELILCPWCVSVWVAAGVLIARSRFPRAWAPVARLLALAAAAALVAANEPAPT